MGVYTTTAQLRLQPEIPDASPPTDAELEQLILRAEDQIDAWLGVWPIQADGPSAGRKIVETDVDAWRWDKLSRATTLLAATLYATPEIMRQPEYSTVQGPDFYKSTPNPRATGPRNRLRHVVAPLEASGLRILTARAVP